MARNVRIILIDDLDGKELAPEEAHTITFALNGAEYEIDLSKKNADAMEKAFSRYVEAARKMRKASTNKAKNRSALVDAGTGVNPKEVRKWAVGEGLIPGGSRGRIPNEVVEKYKVALAS